MKRLLCLLLILTLLLSGIAAAFAESEETDAIEIIEQCTVKLDGKKSGNLTDKKFTSYCDSKKVKNPELVISSKTPVYGIYLCFRTMPEGYEIIADGNKVCDGDPEILHAYYELDGVKEIRVRATDDGKTVMGFNEVYAFSKGHVPEWVQRWEKTPENADILFFVAHPDEELLYLGGAIPYYATERGCTVAVASLTWVNTTKRSEMLNSLWSMGYRYYPVFGDFKEGKGNNVRGAYKSVDSKKGEEKVLEWVTGVIRRCRPQVIVAPDENGEGSNGQRMMLADACKKCFTIAADADRFPVTAEKYGTWEAQKLYLHLYGKDQITFDWNAPMTRFNGQTGMDLAMYAFLYYKTLVDAKSSLSVQGTGTQYANNTFGLYASLVGDDTEHNDFLENITEENLHPSAFAIRALNPLPEGILPELNENGYIDSGEFIHSDSTQGHWVYISPTLKIIITRKFDGSLPLTWYESEIWCDTDAGEMMRCYEVNPEKKTKYVADAADTAKQYHTVFAVNADYYTYRVSSKNGHPKGIEIRNGEIYYDSHYTEETNFFPNLDTLAFYLDGTAKVHHSYEMSAQDYLNDGAYLVYSFGPYLVRDGVLKDWVMDETVAGYRTKDPRHGMGMIGKGHFLDITAEGRLGTRSEGVTKTQLALLMKAAGCTEACNLDGGETAILVFMGQQLNAIRNRVEQSDRARKLNEILGIGNSEQVGVFKVN